MNVKKGKIFGKNGQKSWKLGVAQAKRGRHNSLRVQFSFFGW